MKGIIYYLNLWLVFRDSPDHTKFRWITRRAITADAIEQMLPNIEDISQIRLDRIDCNAGQQVEFIRDFASRLPACVIMNLPDVPRDMTENFKKW